MASDGAFAPNICTKTPAYATLRPGTYTEKTIVRRDRTTASSHGKSPSPESNMSLSTRCSGSKARRGAAVGFIALVALLAPAPVATADRQQDEDRRSVIVLPGAKGAEGITQAKAARSTPATS
jgi:hypothetical protein